MKRYIYFQSYICKFISLDSGSRVQWCEVSSQTEHPVCCGTSSEPGAREAPSQGSIDTNSNRQGEPHLIYLVYLGYLPGYRVIRDNIGKGSLLSIRLIYMHTKQGLTVECTLLIT